MDKFDKNIGKEDGWLEDLKKSIGYPVNNDALKIPSLLNFDWIVESNST